MDCYVAKHIKPKIFKILKLSFLTVHFFGCLPSIHEQFKCKYSGNNNVARIEDSQSSGKLLYKKPAGLCWETSDWIGRCGYWKETAANRKEWRCFQKAVGTL